MLEFCMYDVMQTKITVTRVVQKGTYSLEILNIT